MALPLTMEHLSQYPLALLSVLLPLGYLILRISQKDKLPYPPGPRPLPLIGNVLDIPTKLDHVVYAEWSKIYGDVIHLTALGKHILILNSFEAAKELLDQKSAIYSDRPYFPMLMEPSLMDGDWAFPNKGYNKSWKQHRKLFTQHINPTAVRDVFSRIQIYAIHALLRNLISDPAHFEQHILHSSASIILGVAYGYEVRPQNDPLVKLAELTSRQVTEGLHPKYLVNVLPELIYIPSWFPGGGFKTFAVNASNIAKELVSSPYEWTKKRITDGTAPSSFLREALQELHDKADPELEKDSKEVAATMYAAGSDTMGAVMEALILVLAMNPHVQTRAQMELDKVVGSPTSSVFRLPSFLDRPSMPYMEALTKELMRWHPSAAYGFPHATMEEDVYRGWRIPKGTIVFANGWGMLRDEKYYKDPYIFRPERFIPEKEKQAEPDPELHGVFGFGRRICPGQGLAETSLWLTCACLLACFTFKPPKDEHGKEIDLNFATIPLPGFIMHPPPFPCLITPRSRIVENIIEETASETFPS